MPGHINYKKLKKEDPRAFNTAVDMQIEADLERMNKSYHTDGQRNKLIKHYEKNPQDIDEKWYMATFSVYKSKDFSGYMNQHNSPKLDDDEIEDLERERYDNQTMASIEYADRYSEGDNLTQEEKEELADYFFVNPDEIDDDILEDNSLVRTENGEIRSEEEVARLGLKPDKMFGKNKETYLIQPSDHSSMKKMGPGKGWHGERMRHREASLKRKK